MTRQGLLMIRVLAIIATGCDAGTPSPAAEPASEAAPLPAWETPAERARAFKGDEHDDYREAHPELYGVTAPPSGPVGSFAEYRPAQAMMMRPGASIGAFHEGILRGAVGHIPRVVLLHEAGQGDGLADAVEALGFDLDGFQLLDVDDTDAIWTRDYGPISHRTAGGAVGFVDFRYYHGRHRDDAIPTRVAANWGINVYRPSLSFEGGNFMADHQGTCYATEKIHQQNAGHTPGQIDQWMLEYAGCQDVVTLIWPKGLGTGHIDMFAKLMDETTLILGAYDPAAQPVNAAILDDNAARLDAVVTAGGARLSIHRIPLPWDETGVWYTYTNALILNDTVLVPVYSKFKDLEAEALEVYQAAAPQLSVWTVNSDKIIPSGGAIHCVTMTVPEGALSPTQEPPVELCPFNEIDRCEDPGPCGGLPAEGACEGERLLYCGADGYPHAAACDACCAWDPGGAGGLGWFDCLEAGVCAMCAGGCTGEGTAGCSANGTHVWTCAPSATGCLEPVYSSCGPDAHCDADAAACLPGPPPVALCEGTPGCEIPGARACDDAGAAVLRCERDAAGCLDWARGAACPDGTACVDGVCGMPPEPASGDAVSEGDVVGVEGSARGRGCGAGAAPLPGGWLLLLLSLAGVGIRGLRLRGPATTGTGSPGRSTRP
jgi:agmatine/peptidylarginine deiminase